MAKKKICLDAGHYGKYNRSPVNGAYYESDMAWKLHLLVKKYLEQYGFEVILTRGNQATDKGLYDRGASSRGCDLFISIHSNACGTESVDRPVGIYLVDDDCGHIDEESEVIAALLAKTVQQVMGTAGGAQTYSKLASSDRDGDGKRNDDYYGVLYGAHQVGTAGIILEHSFHTNARATAWLLDDGNLDKLARAEAKTIANYYGNTSTGTTDTPTAKPNTSTDTSTAGQAVKPLSGKVKVIYTGEEGLNVRTKPSYGDQYIHHAVKNGTFTVVGISADGNWYKLYSGLYITTGESYVKFTGETVAENATVPTAVPYKVRSRKSVAIRRGAGDNYKQFSVTGVGVFTIVKEKNGYGLLKTYQKAENGWIPLSQVEKV